MVFSEEEYEKLKVILPLAVDEANQRAQES